MNVPTKFRIDPDRYDGSPLPYRRVDTRFVLDRDLAEGGSEATERLVRSLLVEVSLCERRVLGGGDDPASVASIEDLEGVAEVVSRRLSSLPSDDRYLAVDPSGDFMPVPSEIMEGWVQVAGFAHRWAVPTGSPIQARVSHETGRIETKGLGSVRPDIFFERRARMAGFGFHVADDPLFLQYAVAVAASREMGYAIDGDDPAVVHALTLEGAVREASFHSRPDCLDVECLHAVRSGLIEDTPLASLMSVLASAFGRIDASITRDARIFRLARALSCPVGSFLKIGSDERRLWSSVLERIGTPHRPQSMTRGLDIGRDDPVAPLVRLGLARFPSVDGLLMEDGVVDVRAHEDGFLLVRDGPENIQVAVLFV